MTKSAKVQSTRVSGARTQTRAGAASADEVRQQILTLPDLGRRELLVLWERLYDARPPAKISRNLLVRSIAYRLQEDMHGSLSPATKRRLTRLADDLRLRGDAALGTVTRLKPGTRFVREWQGTLHQVTVTPTGFEWQGRACRSLSEIARQITGTRWNGWAFFGARRDAQSRAATGDSSPLPLRASSPSSKPATSKREDRRRSSVDVETIGQAIDA